MSRISCIPLFVARFLMLHLFYPGVVLLSCAAFRNSSTHLISCSISTSSPTSPASPSPPIYTSHLRHFDSFSQITPTGTYDGDFNHFNCVMSSTFESVENKFYKKIILYRKLDNTCNTMKQWHHPLTDTVVYSPIVSQLKIVYLFHRSLWFDS